MVSPDAAIARRVDCEGRRWARGHDEGDRGPCGHRGPGGRALADDNPAATDVLDTVVTVPTVSEAAVIALEPAASVRPTTSGTLTLVGGALSMTSCLISFIFWIASQPLRP